MRYGLLFFFTFFSLALSDTRNPFLAPKSGDVVQSGKQYTIQWNPGSPGPVKIWLAIGGLDPVAVTGKCSSIHTYFCHSCVWES